MNYPTIPACASWAVPPTFDPDGPQCELAIWHGGRCGICGLTPGELVLDHDHDTGLIRGYLCRGCNAKEGAWWPSPAIAYWRTGLNSAALVGLREIYYAHVPRVYVSPERMRAAMMFAASDAPTPTLEERVMDQKAAMRRAMMAAS